MNWVIRIVLITLYVLIGSADAKMFALSAVVWQTAYDHYVIVAFRTFCVSFPPDLNVYNPTTSFRYALCWEWGRDSG